MEDKEFDKLTPEEKKARFQKAFDDYNRIITADLLKWIMHCGL